MSVEDFLKQEEAALQEIVKHLSEKAKRWCEVVGHHRYQDEAGETFDRCVICGQAAPQPERDTLLKRIAELEEKLKQAIHTGQCLEAARMELLREYKAELAKAQQKNEGKTQCVICGREALTYSREKLGVCQGCYTHFEVYGEYSQQQQPKPEEGKTTEEMWEVINKNNVEGEEEPKWVRELDSQTSPKPEEGKK